MHAAGGAVGPSGWGGPWVPVSPAARALLWDGSFEGEHAGAPEPPSTQPRLVTPREPGSHRAAGPSLAGEPTRGLEPRRSSGLVLLVRKRATVPLVFYSDPRLSPELAWPSSSGPKSGPPGTCQKTSLGQSRRLLMKIRRAKQAHERACAHILN